MRQSNKTGNKSLGIKVLIMFAIVAVVSVVAMFLYTSDYYRSEVSIEDFKDSSNINIIEFSQGLFIDGSENDKALIFYPGGKVEYTAYLPLCMQLAEQGVDCFLAEMPFHLAVFGSNKADKIMNSYEYDEWYLAGHSLGGAMAASYVAENVEKVDGLVMLAAYPTKGLVSEKLKVLSIYGNKDEVLNREKLEEGSELVPEHYTEISLGGANHAGFGNYGAQEGDGEASMDREKQQDMTVKYIMRMIEKTYK